MAKQLNVNLAFTADTSKAKAQLQDLQNSLNQVINFAAQSNKLGLDSSLANSIVKATELKSILQSSTTNMGTLDLGAFNASLQKSGLSIKQYASALQSLGPVGTQAFSQLAQSITMAEVPLRKSHTLLQGLGTTLKNTLKWQLSSSLLHGFMGTIQSAYNYAQDLNESLNNIRIVTSKNVDEMHDFAVEANKAAKALSTTTTSYTKASLIYYQQGLNDAEVKERTDVTIKMANVARESSEEVANYMTAVWNNFDDGSKSLEYYADVMTALGAATASSTAEISQGLEKFAAVAETVGLSYEYATAALATVTATTRQSADVVGTAFKTLFARIQDLELGKTLDDGVTLGKYSEALNAVGINILDASGNLMEMDDILDAMAGKWDALTKAQQTSLAQTVAGTRQYTQLVALMENWDFMQENLGVVADSEGTLQEQADIYAESWEAANKRVRAATENIWSELLKDDFFIDLTNGFGKLLEQVKNFIDSLGGVKGVLSTLGTLMFQVWGKNMVASLEKFAYNIKITSETGRQQILKLRQQATESMKNLTNDGSFSGKATTGANQRNAEFQDKVLNKTLQLKAANKELTTEEQKQLQNLTEINNKQTEQVAKSGQLADAAKQRALDLQDEIVLMIGLSGENEKQLKINSEGLQTYNALKPVFSDLSRAASNIKISPDSKVNLADLKKQAVRTEETIKALDYDMASLTKTANSLGANLKKGELEQAFNKIKNGNSIGEVQKGLKDINRILNLIGKNANTGLGKLREELTKNKSAHQIKEINTAFDQLETELKTSGRASADTIQAFKKLGITVDESGKIIQGFKGKTYTAADGLIAMSSMITATSMAINSLKGLSDIWSNDDLSIGEKLLNTFTSLAMVLPMVVNSFNAQNIAKLKGIPISITTALTEKAIALGYMEENGHLTAQIVLKTILNSLDLKKIAIYAAIAAVVGLVVWAVSAWNAEQEKEIKTAEAAAEKVERLTEKYNELTQAVENFNRVQSEYEEAVKGLENLEKGTKEYSQALEEANKKAKELIENYGLYNDYNYDSGIITFDDGVLNQIKAEMQSRADFAEMQKYSAEIYNNEAQLNLKNKELREDIGSKATDEEMVELANAIDTVTQKSGGVTLSSEKLITTLEENAEFLGLSTDLENNLNNIINDETVTSIYSYIDSINKADEANRYYAEQILKYQFENEYGAILRNLAVDEEGNFDQVLYDELSQIFIQNQDELIKANENLSKELNKNLDTSKWDSGKGTEEYIAGILEEQGMGELSQYYDKIFKGRSYNGDINTQEMLEDYFKAQGFDNVKVKDGNNKNTVTYKTTDENGKITEEKLTYSNTEATELWAQQIIDYIVAESLNEEIRKKFGDDQQVEDLTKKLAQASSAYGVNWGQIGREAILNEEFDLSNVFKDLSPSEYEDLLGMTDEQKLALFGLTSEDIKSLTGKTVPEFFNSFNESLKNWTEKDYISQTMSDYEKKAEEFDIDLDEFKAYRNLLKETNEEYRDNVEGLNQVALANKRMEKGVKTLADDWEDLDDIMSDETSTLEDISSILPDINSGLKDILNFSDEQFELLPADFAQKNWPLIQDVINGVEGSIDALRNKAGEEILMTVEGVVDPDGTMRDELWVLHQDIAGFDNTEFEVGVQINPQKYADFIATCNDMIARADMTAEQAQAYFASMGYDTEIEEVPVEKTTTRTVEYPIIDQRTGYPTGEVGSMQLSETTGTTGYAIKTITPNGTYGGGLGVNTTAPSSATSGASGDTSPAKKVDRTKKTDVVERYKEVEDSIDDLNNTLEDINKQADRLYGASRLAQMKKANALVEDEIDLLKEKKRQAQDYLKQDFDALGQAAANAGVVFELDEKGNITNYTEQMSALYEELAAAEHYMDTAFSTSEDQDEYQESTVQPIQDKIDELTEAISQYEETRKLLEDLDNEIDDKFYEWQDANYEMLTYEIEFKLEINDLELKRIDYYLSKYNDDVYTQAEAIFELSKKKDFYLEQLEVENYRYEELQKKYEAGEISQTDYADGLKITAENTWEAAEQLREYDNEMMEFYSNTLAKANEEVTKYTDNMDAAASALEHYKNIAKLAGREQDYSLMGAMLEGSVKMKANDLAVSKQMYQNATSEVERIKGELAAATSKEQRELLQKELDAAEAQANEWQDKMLTDVEEYLTAQKELYDNNIEALNASFEKLATGGDGFDILKNKMSSLSEHAEEFLTDTNKIYETEKMIRNIDKEIGSTSNTIAQKKLKAFRQQTQELQNQKELSQFELNIQQAKYDLLLAEIALEESRNAKTTMRLARDSMGNYSYVYTADAKKVAEAEQQVSDAQNKLYNTRLDGANKYGEQLASIRQEWIEAIEGLDRNDADYYAKRDALNEYYMGKMADVSHLYAIATGEDALIAQDAWTTSIVNQIGSVEDFEQNMKTYLSNIDAEWDTYKEKVDEVTTDVGLDLDDAETSVKDLTDKHEDLRKKLVNEVIPALQTETTEVGNVVSAYGELRQGIMDTITEYEKLGEAATDAYNKIANTPDTSGGNNENPEDNNIDLPNDTEGYVPESSGTNAEVKDTSIVLDNDKPTEIPLILNSDDEKALKIRSYNENGNDYSGGKGFEYGKIGTMLTNKLESNAIIGYKPGVRIDGKTHNLFKLKDAIAVKYKISDKQTSYIQTHWLNTTDLQQILGTTIDLSKYNLKQYDSGGYTGQWGPEGKLAVLHEKELVLNKQDTENLLKVIDVIRANNLIDAQVAQIQNTIATYNAVTSLAQTYKDAADEATREINIYADFPGVRSAIEIETALRNLANDAAQYSGINWD